MDMVFSMLPEFTLIIDALDECSDQDQSTQLIHKLNTLSRFLNGRVILLSRQNPAFVEHLQLPIAIHMDWEAIGTGVLLYASREIDRTPKLKGIKSQFIDRVKMETGGMFLWVSMMLKHVRTATTRKMQEDYLTKFPPRLADVYEQFLQETAVSLTEDELVVRKDIFTILVGALRELTTDEVSSMFAMRSSPGPEPGDSLMEPESIIRKLCWPLVECDCDRVRLIHTSVWEFLVSEGRKDHPRSLIIPLEDSRRYLAHACVNQLCHYERASWDIILPYLETNTYPREPNDSTPRCLHKLDCLYDYAATYWHCHILGNGFKISRRFAHRLARWMDSPGFILWAEYMFHSRSLSDMGPVLSVKAEMKSWYISLDPHLCEIIPLDSFLLGPYGANYDKSRQDGADHMLSILLLYRIAHFLNLESNESERVFMIRKTIKDETSKRLGETHPFALRCAADFAIELIISLSYDEAESLLKTTSTIQKSLGRADSFGVFYSMSYDALSKYYQMKFDEAIELQELAVQGLTTTLGATNKETLKSKLYLGWTLEAQNELGKALEIYKHIWTLWATLQSVDNPLTMMAQCSMSIVERKLGNYHSALVHASEVLANRQRVMGDHNTITFDSALNHFLIYRDMKKHDQARAMLELAGSLGIGHQATVRMCQLERLQAYLHVDEDENCVAMSVLKNILDRATTSRMDANRELLAVRLDLSTLLRQQGAEEEALNLFRGLVRTDDMGKVYDSVDILRSAETAARHLIMKELREAETLLDSKGYKWVDARYYWIPAGGPYMGV